MKTDGWQEIERVLACFSLEGTAAEPSEQAGCGEIPVICGGSRYLLKREDAGAEARLEAGASFLSFLSSRGVPVSVPLDAADGKPYARVEGGVYRLTPLRDGEWFDEENEEQLREAGTLLAAFHNAAQAFPAAEEGEAEPSAPLRLLDELYAAHEADMNPVQRQIVGHLRDALGLSEGRAEAAAPSLPSVPVHGFFHPASVRFSGDRACALLGVGAARRKPRLCDLADGLAFFAALREKPLDPDSEDRMTGWYAFDVERSRIFLGAYRKAAQRPLSHQEAEALPEFLIRTVIARRVQAAARLPAARQVGLLTSWTDRTVVWLEENGDKLTVLLS